VTTECEADQLRSLEVSTRYDVIANGVDSAFFTQKKTAASNNQFIVFLGRMDYFPNIDAVCHFAYDILPVVRKTKPKVMFRVIGSNPSRRVKQLASIDGVTVTGHVSDVRPYAEGAAVSVAPLRIARGTQNKILESMAMGIPVVASPEAAKGIRANQNEHFLVADNPTLFAKHILDVLTDDQLRNRLCAAAKAQIEKSHSWSNSMGILDRILATPEKSEHVQTD